MVTIIIGAIGVGLFYGLIGSTALYIGIPLILLIILCPVEGYNNRVCETTVLLKLKNTYKSEKEKEYYLVYRSGRVTYAFDNSREYDLGGDAYELMAVRGKIKIYESKSCETAIMKKYTTRPTRDLFTFAPFSTKVQYVFYVPDGTVYYSDKKGL